MYLSHVMLVFVYSFRNLSSCKHLVMTFNFSDVHSSSVNQHVVLQKRI